MLSLSVGIYGKIPCSIFSLYLPRSPIAGPAVPKLEPLPSTSAVKLSEDDLGMLEGQEENSAVSQVNFSLSCVAIIRGAQIFDPDIRNPS